MARTARHKSSEAAFYHLTNRVTGWTDWFPFENRQARRKLLNMMLFYVAMSTGVVWPLSRSWAITSTSSSILRNLASCPDEELWDPAPACFMDEKQR